MISQDPMTSLNPVFTVEKQMVEMICRHTDMDKKKASAHALSWLKRVGIPEAEKRMKEYPYQLSGGMCQRVIIAMALSCDPKVLIADEPTTALDVTIQAQIIDLMKDIQKKLGTTIILITHDLGVVAGIADKVVVMYSGKIMEKGDLNQIFYGHRHPYTWALLRSVPRLGSESKEELYALGGTPPDLLLPLNHCPFADRCEYCMPICKERKPPETVLSDTHKVSCWLMHEKAPKVESFYDRRDK